MERHIVHLDIPDFYATLEQLRHCGLQRRPLALAEPGPRALVQGVNAIARREGIREAMPLSQARRTCRRLQVLPPDHHFYRRQYHLILQDLHRLSPLVEGNVWGHYFVDLSGTRRLWGAPPDVAYRLEKRLAGERQVRARVGLGATKLISQVAANLVAPGDLCDIFPGGEAAFLTPLPVTALPGVGMVTAARLADFNIQRVGELAALSAGALCAVFGRLGTRLLRLARGIDPSPVIPFQQTPRFSLTTQLERDEIDRGRLEAVLWRQVEEAAWFLRQHHRVAGEGRLEIRYADGATAPQRQRLAPLTSHLDQRLFQALQPALHQLTRRRVAVRRMTLELSQFAMPFRQLSLFPWEEQARRRDQQVQQAIDDIRRRFGRQAISWGPSAKNIAA